MIEQLDNAQIRMADQWVIDQMISRGHFYIQPIKPVTQFTL